MALRISMPVIGAVGLGLVGVGLLLAGLLGEPMVPSRPAPEGPTLRVQPTTAPVASAAVVEAPRIAPERRDALQRLEHLLIQPQVDVSVLSSLEPALAARLVALRAEREVSELRQRAAQVEAEAIASEIARARQALPRLEADLRERTALRADGFSSRRGLERAQADLEQARAVLRIAESRAGVAAAERALAMARRASLELEERDTISRAVGVVRAELAGVPDTTGSLIRR
jgi:hypothetical protein